MSRNYFTHLDMKNFFLEINLKKTIVLLFLFGKKMYLFN